jgi:hypothetical protein
MRPELQKRYAGYFAPHVQRKIDALKAERRAFERAMREKPAFAGKVAVPSVAYK